MSAYVVGENAMGWGCQFCDIAYKGWFFGHVRDLTSAEVEEHKAWFEIVDLDEVYRAYRMYRCPKCGCELSEKGVKLCQ